MNPFFGESKGQEKSSFCKSEFLGSHSFKTQYQTGALFGFGVMTRMFLFLPQTKYRKTVNPRDMTNHGKNRQIFEPFIVVNVICWIRNVFCPFSLEDNFQVPRCKAVFGEL